MVVFTGSMTPLLNSQVSMVSLAVAGHTENLLVFTKRLARRPAVLVRVESTDGSAPREAGAWMAVFGDAVIGTVGGGNLEHHAITRAREMLGEAPSARLPTAVTRFALGPSLGQCCGGVVRLRFEHVGAGDGLVLASTLDPRLTPVALFGAGHVGQALVRALAPLPFRIVWIDSRDAVFPESVPAGVACEHSAPSEAAVAGLAPGSRVLIMSFSHAEDLDVVAACLQRQRERTDMPFIGLIGSQTKWASFQRRLEARGFSAAELAHVTCPIGIPGIAGKEPEVIAVAVAAQLLQTLGQA